LKIPFIKCIKITNFLLKNPKSTAIINVQLNEKTEVSMIYITFYRYYVGGGGEGAPLNGRFSE